MAITPAPLQTWTKTKENRNFLISTDSSKIPIADFNQMLASKECYWSLSMPEDAVRETLKNSWCFSLHELIPTSTTTTTTTATSDNLKFIGVARCITDTTTFLYLTDVHILSSYQGLGLGKWLVQCVRAVVEEMPCLRRSMLLTGDWNRSVPFYARELEMKVMEGAQEGVGIAVMTREGPGFPGRWDASGKR